tara:strand:+ start:5872 stop:7446 length:1575 start_codon:yes stop_codon:yes gene_type:complete
MGKSDIISAAQARAGAPARSNQPWRVVVADPDESVHQKVIEALSGLKVIGRQLEISCVRSSRELIGHLVDQPDTALVIMDAMAQFGDSGIDAAGTIRHNLKNRRVRLVMLNSAEEEIPSSELITRYDINDIRHKSDLSQGRLFTLTYSNLLHYQELMVAEENREGLELIVDASTTILRRKLPERLAKGALELLCSILGVDQYCDEPKFDAVMLTGPNDPEMRLLASHGRLANANSVDDLPLEVMASFCALQPESDDAIVVRGDAHLYARISGESDLDICIWLRSDSSFKEIDDQVINLFCRNIANSLHAADVHQSLSKTQNGLILMLSEAIERRSLETGNHVRRVGEYSRLLGLLYGLDEAEADILLIGAALHDAGKVAIPDAILNKPGKLTDKERAIMQTHAEIGGRMFEKQDLPVLRAAMIISVQHHEKWDGTGYPNGLAGENIHLYGRIAGLADVFDALGSDRCYKRAWPIEKTLALLRAERGKHFDPMLIDLFLEHLPKFLEIRDRFIDPPVEEMICNTQ